MNSFALVHPDDQGNLREQLTNLIGHAEEVLCLEYRVRCKDDTWRWIEGTATNLLDNPQVGAQESTFISHEQLLPASVP